MPYYHATFRRHIPSILKHGLGGLATEQNWDGCDPGVYLAADPAICIFVMLDQYLQFGDDDSVPSEHFDNIVIIVIDDTRIRKEKLGKDPLLERRDDVWRYEGVLDVTGMPIIDIQTAADAIIAETPEQASIEETMVFLRETFGPRE